MTTLQDQLDEITANTRDLVQADRLAISERSVEELFATGIEDRILPVGALAPEFALHDATGRLIRSQDMLALGPLVIKFFRGRWCPYCVTELEAWRDLYRAMRERGALMVAIGPQTSKQNDFMADQHRLPFPCSPIPAARWQKNSAWPTPFPSTCAIIISLSSSTFPLSMATQAGGCRYRQPMSSPRPEASSSPRLTPISASAPSPKRRWPRSPQHPDGRESLYMESCAFPQGLKPAFLLLHFRGTTKSCPFKGTDSPSVHSESETVSGY